jgi:hypothetical protein
MTLYHCLLLSPLSTTVTTVTTDGYLLFHETRVPVVTPVTVVTPVACARWPTQRAAREVTEFGIDV